MKNIYTVVFSLVIFNELPAQITFQKSYGDEYGQFGYFVQQVDDGGYITGGSIFSFGQSRDFLLVKTDSIGNHMWSKTFGNSLTNDYAYSFHRTTDGGYILAGITDDVIGYQDIYI